MSHPEITPAAGPLFIVRWIREDGRDAKHRYFRRQVDAVRFFTKLQVDGREPALYETDTRWSRRA